MYISFVSRKRCGRGRRIDQKHCIGNADKYYKMANTHWLFEQFSFHHALWIDKNFISHLHVPYFPVRPERVKSRISKRVTALKVSCSPYGCKWNPIFSTFHIVNGYLYYKNHFKCIWSDRESEKKRRERNPLQSDEWKWKSRSRAPPLWFETQTDSSFSISRFCSRKCGMKNETDSSRKLIRHTTRNTFLRFCVIQQVSFNWKNFTMSIEKWKRVFLFAWIVAEKDRNWYLIICPLVMLCKQCWSQKEWLKIKLISIWYMSREVGVWLKISNDSSYHDAQVADQWSVSS